MLQLWVLMKLKRRFFTRKQKREYMWGKLQVDWFAVDPKGEHYANGCCRICPHQTKGLAMPIVLE